MFDIGSQRYNLRVAGDNERIEFDGEQCLGLSFEDDQTILISPLAKPDQRFYILMHQISRAHLFVGPRPMDDNSLCNFVASVSVKAFHDLAMCGGELALHRLAPGESLKPMTGRIALTRERYCFKCQGTIAGGDVKCTIDAMRPGELKMEAGCEFCGHKQVWHELMTMGGLPSGFVTDEPQIAVSAAGDFSLPAVLFEDYPQ